MSIVGDVSTAEVSREAELSPIAKPWNILFVESISQYTKGVYRIWKYFCMVAVSLKGERGLLMQEHEALDEFVEGG